MNEKILATVGILTYNSEKTLERALISVKDFGEIVVCDGGSMDGTRILAERYGARIIEQDHTRRGPITDFSAVRNRCLGAARYDWFFWLDADETAEPGLVEEIRDLVRKNPPGSHACRISPRIIYKGRLIEYSSSYPGYQIRFFKRGSGITFRKPIHESIVYPADTQVHTFRGHWYYYLDGPDDMLIDLSERDLPAIIRRYELKPFWWKLFGIKNEFQSIIRISVMSIWNLFIHPSSSMPWEIERTRIFVHWRSMLSLLGIPFHYERRS